MTLLSNKLKGAHQQLVSLNEIYKLKQDNEKEMKERRSEVTRLAASSKWLAKK